MTRLLLWLMAAGTGMSAATIYLSQPLLEVLRQQFNVSQSDAGFIVTLTQIGYALGLLFLTPLGDIANKKVLIQIKLSVIALILIIAGLSQNLALFLIASLGIGIFASAAQDFVPLAADLAKKSDQGKVVGTVMSGLLIGILLSRTFAGLTAHYLGWRYVFFICAALVIIILIAATIAVPAQHPKAQFRYTELMHSMAQLFIESRVLQLTVLTQGLIGMTFAAFWTVITFELSGAPFYLSSASIGLLGLAGAAGALGAPIAGKIADRKGPLLNIKVALLLVFLSFSAMLAVQHQIWIIIAAAVIMDLGVQIALISHQTIIYRMSPNASSRVTSLFVTGLFIFLALGSFTGNLMFAHYDWTGVMVLSMVCCVLGLMVHLILSERYKAIENRGYIQH